MAEQKLSIVQNGKYNNLYLKPSPSKGQPGLDNGNHIIVEKKYIEGRKIASTFNAAVFNYSCIAKYDGVDVSFFLNEKEHTVFKDIAGVGDKVKITLVESIKMTNKGKKVVCDLVIEAV